MKPSVSPETQMSLNPSCLFCPFFVFIHVCMCVFVMCRCTRKRMCAYVWGTEVDVRSSLRSCFCSKASQSNPELADMASLASQLALRILCLLARVTDWLPCPPGICMGSGNPNCVPCTCLAGALTAEPSPRPFLLVFPSPHVNSKLNICDRTICCRLATSCPVLCQQRGADATVSPGLSHVPSQFLQVHLASLCLCLHRKSRAVVK